MENSPTLTKIAPALVKAQSEMSNAVKDSKNTTVCARLKEFGIEKRKCGKKNIPIICTTDGLRFDSINDAAKHYSVFRENIRKVLKGIYSHRNQLKFIYEKK